MEDTVKRIKEKAVNIMNGPHEEISETVHSLLQEIESLETEIDSCRQHNYTRERDIKNVAKICAQIANECCRDSEGYDRGCDTEDKILKRFNLEK